MKYLVDKYSRRIRYIRISVTDRCNLRCRYCMPVGGIQWLPHDSIMRYEEFLRIIQICAKRGVEKIRITGGEPLVRRGILGFLERIKAIDNIKELTLTTNGLLLGSLAKDLRSVGIDRVNISLDTLNKDKFVYITRVDALDKVLSGIENALSEGFAPVKINVVAIKGFNDEEISSFARLTMDTPIDVRFIELMPIGCASKFGSSSVMKSYEIRQLIERSFGEMEPLAPGLGPAQVFRLPGARGKVGFISPLSDNSFCSRCNRIRLTANGYLRPCLLWDYELDILGPIRRGITDQALEELLEQGIMSKPGSHKISYNYSGRTISLMNEIGG